MAFSRPAGPHRQRPAAASNSPPPHNLLAQPLQRHVHAAAHPPGAAADGQRAAPAPAARSTSRDSRSGSRSTRNGTSSAAPRAPPPSQPSKASAPHGAREQHKAPAQAAAPPPSWQQQQQQRLQATGDRPGAGRGPRGPAPPPSTQGGPDQRQRSRDSGAKKADRKAAKATKLSAEQELTQRRKGCCYGCGAKLQTDVALGPGYVPLAKFEAKAKHKQLDKVLCERCSELCNGAMIPAVEDWTQRLQAQALLEARAESPESLQLLGKALVTPEQLRTQLMEVAGKKAVVVLLVDLTDASGTLMAKVRDMVGRNPIVLVGTKMDLLPDGTHPRDVAEWLQEAAQRKALNVVSCHLVSSHTGEGVPSVTGKVCKERKGRDVYVVGAANVGKSAFVRAMLKEMAKFDGGNFDPAAMANGRYLPVESPMPGTTLGIIPLRAFASGGNLFDTPGVHLHHRVPHMLSPAELKLLHPRKRLQPLIPPTPLDLTSRASPSPSPPAQDAGAQEDEEEEAPQATNPWEELPPDVTGPGLPKRGKTKRQAAGKAGPSRVRGTYTWSGLVRVDVVDAPPSAALAFVGPTSLRVAATPLDPAEFRQALAAAATNSAKAAPAAAPGSADGGGGASGAVPAAGAAEAATQQQLQQQQQRVLSCEQSVAARGGLVPHHLTVKVDGSRAPLADVAVSGVPGWVTVWAPGARRDVQLCVWAPKGVEVFLRPPLPCPSPFQALAQRGEGDGEEEGALPEGMSLAALQQLASDYEGGGAASGVNDAAWWEAAIEELGAVGDEDEEEEGEVVEEGEEEEEEGRVARRRPRLPGLRGRRGLAGARDGDGGGGERIVMQATVEEILRRPRLDFGLAELDFGDEEEEEEEEDEEEGENADEVRRAGSGAQRGAQRGRVRQPAPASFALADLVDEEEQQEEEEVLVGARAGRAAVRRPLPQQRRTVGLRGRRGLQRAGAASQRLEEEDS